MQANSSYIAINNMNTRVFALLFFAVLTGLVSCKDKDLPPVTPLNATLNVVNASADTIKFYINGTRQDNVSNLFVGGQTSYQYVISGTQNYKFSKATGNFAPLFTTTLTLDTGQVYYSYFVAGPSADLSFLTVDPLAYADTLVQKQMLIDTLGAISALRFINASPNSGSLNVTVGIGDTLNYSNCAFKYVGAYRAFNANAKEVKVFQNGSSAPLIDTTINFTGSNYYTLFTKGQPGGQGTARFSVSLISFPL
jgi:hypothetical protein